MTDLTSSTVSGLDTQPGGLALAEQAIHLLRHGGGPALVAYYTGTLPFVLGLLFFLVGHEPQSICHMVLRTGSRRYGAAVHLDEAVAGPFWPAPDSRR